MDGWGKLLVVPVLVSLFGLQQSIRSSADVVPVDVLVTGSDGKPVKGLTARQFTVTEDGTGRPVLIFSADRRPFTVAVIVDSTWSMELMTGQTRARNFMETLLGSLDPDDQTTIGSLTRRVIPLTRDKTSALRVLRERPLLFRTDSVAPGSDLLEVPTERGIEWASNTLASVEGRKVIVILTDGRSPDGAANELRLDQSGYRLSSQTALALVERASRINASIQVIGFDDTMVEEEFLRAVVSAGGGAMLVTREANLVSVCRDFVNDLHSEYLLGFEPSKFDGKSHRITVKVDRPGVKVRARTSYFAPKR